ncbi:hypothetical protein AMECASPLE_029661 [Ameca splendens]|uniref:Uncharacterized protein n=1 Tax=Ameca splendens TaxID=208324 RepID=A0ABV0YGY7_9TELE
MKVWRLNVRSQQRKVAKLDQNYLGPYTIISISRKSVDLQDNQGKITSKINVDHLRVYTEELPRVPRKSNQNYLLFEHRNILHSCDLRNINSPCDHICHSIDPLIPGCHKTNCRSFHHQA